MKTYGQFRKDTYPIEAYIWGHRLRDGQHWMEYLLEFLSVLAGYGYAFGKTDEYTIPKRLGLRRFVFYDEREKTQDARDKQATLLLKEALAKKIDSATDKTIQQIQVLLRSFSVIENNRSWYAKSLFPVHENLLLWEALRKGSTQQTYRGNIKHLLPAELDRGIEFNARNFFARGGELYYLMISAGTQSDPDRRQRIAQRLRILLTERNQTLGELARLIDQTWQEKTGDNKNASASTPGWIPDPDCELYQQFAEDLDILLDNELDGIETLELLAHLIGFHIIVYIYYRALPPHKRRPELLIDVPGDEESQIIRSLSANQLRLHEQWQIERVKRYIKDWLENIEAQTTPEQFLTQVKEQASKEYLESIRKKSRESFEDQMQRIEQEQAQNSIEQLVDVLYEHIGKNFRDHFIGVHRRLGRAIGLIAPSRGPQPRFVLGDNLLKTLTITALRPDQKMTFGQFLETLHERYGIIVGPGEARQADFLKLHKTNEGVFARNRDRFLLRMKLAGLLTQYSDATAMVHRP